MKAAVILSGCGNKDGSEIHESVFTLLSLEERGFLIDCYALDQDMASVIHHNSDEVSIHKRNILQESARISRGKISPISDLSANNYDCLVIPGGFGVALNLSNFASQGEKAIVHHKIVSAIEEFYKASKYIASVCIAPILLAKVLHTQKVIVTIGRNDEIASIIKRWGAIHQNCERGSFVFDEKNKVLSTPAYMYSDSSMQDVYKGIKDMIAKMTQLVCN